MRGLGIGIGLLPEAPWRQCLTECGPSPLARNVSPDDAVPKCREADGYEKPTPRGRPDEERRDASKDPNDRECGADDPNRMRRFTTQSHCCRCLTVD